MIARGRYAGTGGPPHGTEIGMHDIVLKHCLNPGQQVGTELLRARLRLITVRFGSAGWSSHSTNQTIETPGTSRTTSSQVSAESD